MEHEDDSKPDLSPEPIQFNLRASLALKEAMDRNEREERARRWQEENKETLESCNKVHRKIWNDG